MKTLLTQFISGLAVTFPVKNLERFRDTIFKLPDLYEYDCIYFDDQVTVKRRM